MRWIGLAALLAACLAGVFVWDATLRAPVRAVGEAAGEPENPDPGAEESPAAAPEFVALVRNEEGEPVAGARLATKEPPREARGDEAGRIALPGDADARELRAWIRHPDYLTTGVLLYRDSPLEVVLERGTPVVVRVVTASGEPVPGALVRAHPVFGTWSRGEEVEGRTDAAGRAALDGWAPGDVQARVDHLPFAPTSVRFAVTAGPPVEAEIVVDGGGAVGGRVVSPGGEPVAKALVAGGEREARTDEEGRFLLEHLAPGQVLLMASHPGFGPGEFGEAIGWGRQVPVPVRAGQTTPGIEIVLGKPFHVTGRLVDDRGEPLAGVAVNVRAWHSVGSSKDVVTGADGRFRAGPWRLRRSDTRIFVNWKPPRGFDIAAVDQKVSEPGDSHDVGEVAATRLACFRGSVRHPPEPERGIVKVFAGDRARRVGRDDRFEIFAGAGNVRLTASAWPRDGTRMESEPVEIEAKAGETREGIELELKPLATIRGRVVDAAGQPLYWQTVAAFTTGGGADPVVVVTDEQGDYQLFVRGGADYRVGLSEFMRNRKTVLLEEPPPRTVPPGATGVDFVRGDLKKASICGRVVAKRDGRPLRKFSTMAEKHVFFIPRGSWFHQHEDEDGRFRMEIDEPGTYAVEVRAEGHASFKTKTFKLAAGAHHDVGEIRLGDGGRIVGRVRDAAGGPVPYAQIHILSAKLEARWSPPFTDLDGEFEHERVAPGRYTVFAVSPNHPLLIRRNVQVREGETVRLALEFSRASPLRIVVRDEAGQPLEGVQLVYTFSAMQPFTSEQVGGYEPLGYGANETDAHGAIFKPQMPEAELTLRFEKKGFETETRKAKLVRGEERVVEIRLRRAR